MQKFYHNNKRIFFEILLAKLNIRNMFQPNLSDGYIFLNLIPADFLSWFACSAASSM